MSTNKRLEDILAAIQSIEGYQVSSYDEFEHDEKTQDAIVKDPFFAQGRSGESGLG